MRAEFLGQILSVVRRDYTRKDGTSGVAHTVTFSANNQILTDDFFRSDEDFAKMGITAGAIGTLVINVKCVEKQTREGKPFTSREWNFMDFRLANNNQPQPQPQPAVAPSEPQPAAPAAQEANINPDTGLPF